ncbi:hypothetical protein J6590_056656 [Homalodisca vitripennis]|nr:hypothetical protein J6590_056656 [Homalodisca vitripennis]
MSLMCAHYLPSLQKMKASSKIVRIKETASTIRIKKLQALFIGVQSAGLSYGRRVVLFVLLALSLFLYTAITLCNGCRGTGLINPDRMILVGFEGGDLVL